MMNNITDILETQKLTQTTFYNRVHKIKWEITHKAHFIHLIQQRIEIKNEFAKTSKQIDNQIKQD